MKDLKNVGIKNHNKHVASVLAQIQQGIQHINVKHVRTLALGVTLAGAVYMGLSMGNEQADREGLATIGTITQDAYQPKISQLNDLAKSIDERIKKEVALREKLDPLATLGGQSAINARMANNLNLGTAAMIESYRSKLQTIEADLNAPAGQVEALNRKSDHWVAMGFPIQNNVSPSM